MRLGFSCECICLALTRSLFQIGLIFGFKRTDCVYRLLVKITRKMRSVVFCLFALGVVVTVSEKSPKQKTPKYVVYPGLDVSNAAIATWLNGYSSPWNVFFGNQPYVVGWVGQEAGDDDYDEDYSDFKEEEVTENHSSPAVEAPHDEVTEDRRKKHP